MDAVGGRSVGPGLLGALGSSLDLLGRAGMAFAEDGCGQMAAAIAYYAIFSVFPFLIFLVGAVGLTLGDRPLQRALIAAAIRFVPLPRQGGQNLLLHAAFAVTGRSGAEFSLVGLAGMFWAASGMFGAIRRSIKRAFGVQRVRPLPLQKLMDLGMVLGGGVFLLASVGATALVRAISQPGPVAAVGPLPHRHAPMAQGLHLALYTVPLLFAFAAFLVLYRYGPDDPTIRWRDVLGASLVASLLFLVAQVGLAYGVEPLTNFNLVYGPLAAVIVFLLWVYLSASILLFGAELASEQRRRRLGLDGGGPPAPLGRQLLELGRRLLLHPPRG